MAAVPSETICCDGTGVPARPGKASESRRKDSSEAHTREANILAFRRGGEGATTSRRLAAVEQRGVAGHGRGTVGVRGAAVAGGVAFEVRTGAGQGGAGRWREVIWNVASESFPDAKNPVGGWRSVEKYAL